MPIKTTRSVKAAKINPVEWAYGIMAMQAIAGDSRVPWLAGLLKAVREAKRILKTHIKDVK